ncbi:MAG: aminopeptidase P family protein [candidate division WOR-3 bacterium]|uniref:Aminopeptidase P family protein n=1 Tax=candidate division WOR-3 bacterium TaxID=2052148 RepID=A0A7V3ZTG5_UNCW3
MKTTEPSLTGLKNLKSRIKYIREKMDELKIDAYFIYYLPNVSYLTGFRGSSGFVIVTHNKSYFITDSRYEEESKKEIEEEFEILIHKGLTQTLKKARFMRYIKRIGFEKDWMPYGVYKNFEKELNKKFVPCEDIVRKIRIHKNDSEIEKIKKAQRINEKIFEEIIDIIKPDKVREIDLAAEIEYKIKKSGGEVPFPPIVATGSNSALPHAKPGKRIIKNNKPLKIDMGVKYKGFCSDMTRTIWIGKKPSQEFIKIYQIVLDAQNKAIESIKIGMEAKEVDGIARKHIEEKGYGKFFGHGLGHGIGIEVHELPALSPLSKDKIEEGMVFTIEPGIYLPNRFGVRIEDLVCIKNREKFVITKTTKNLIKI